MSIFNRLNHLSVGPYSTVAIADLPVITRPPGSVSATESVSGSAESATSGIIDRNERCLITKSLHCTHERAHWISAVRKDLDRKIEIVSPLTESTLSTANISLIKETFIINLGIVDAEFDLDDASNLANREYISVSNHDLAGLNPQLQLIVLSIKVWILMPSLL